MPSMNEPPWAPVPSPPAAAPALELIDCSNRLFKGRCAPKQHVLCPPAHTHGCAAGLPCQVFPPPALARPPRKRSQQVAPWPFHPPPTSPQCSFGSIKAVRMGPAPPAIYPGQQAAEVYFATVGQAAAALTALNAIVVPALSGRQQLEIRCWVQPKGAAAAQAHGRQARTPQAAGRLQQAQQAQHGIVSLQGPTQHALSAGPSEPAAAKGPSLELPGVTDLPAALDFCSSCCYKAVPGGSPAVAPRQLCWLPLAAACRAAAGPPGQARTA